MKVKNMDNIGGTFKFVCEVYFGPPFFFAKKLHFGIKIYFPLFLVFFFVRGFVRFQ